VALHLHPTRREALAAGDTTLILWSLEGARPTVLARHSVAPRKLRQLSYDPCGILGCSAEATGTPDGELFAMPSPLPPEGNDLELWGIELRRWDGLAVARTIPISHNGYGLSGLACSPDGRWLVVVDGFEWVHLIDWHTGAVSHTVEGSSRTHGLAFDPSSTYLAGLLTHQSCGCAALWRVVPPDAYVPSPREDAWYRDPQPPDVVNGDAALMDIRGPDDGEDACLGHWDDQESSGAAAFSPDGRALVFRRGCELLAYDVASGARLWRTPGDERSAGAPLFSPDGSHIVILEAGGDLCVYQADTGDFVQRLPTGISEPITGMAFDRDGSTLWLATEDGLLAYQPRM